MSKEAIEKTILEYFAALSELNEERWLAVFAEDAETQDPVGSPSNIGIDGLRIFFRNAAAVFDRVDLKADQIFVSGNGAGVKWSGGIVGKNERKASIEGIDVFEMNSEWKIRRLWAYWDPASMAAELKGS